MWTDSIKKEKTDFLVSLLTTAEVEVDCRTEDGNTPLHLAVKVGCFVVYTPEEGDVKIILVVASFFEPKYAPAY